MLEVASLHKTYGGLTAIDDVDFAVGEGEVVGLMGPNGAGKTTLFDAITGVTPPDSGSVRFRDEELAGAKPNRVVRAGVARTFQRVRAFEESTVFENALTGAVFGAGLSDEAARERARGVLSFVGLADDADRHGSDLPAAARKRVGLARALATDPELVLLDEIGSGLTPAEIDELTAIIERIRDERDVSVLWIEHVTDALFSGADRVLVLDDGALIADGTPAEIRTDDRVAEAYLGTSADAIPGAGGTATAAEDIADDGERTERAEPNSVDTLVDRP